MYTDHPQVGVVANSAQHDDQQVQDNQTKNRLQPPYHLPPNHPDVDLDRATCSSLVLCVSERYLVPTPNGGRWGGSKELPVVRSVVQFPVIVALLFMTSITARRHLHNIADSSTSYHAR